VRLISPFCLPDARLRLISLSPKLSHSSRTGLTLLRGLRRGGNVQPRQDPQLLNAVELFTPPSASAGLSSEVPLAPEQGAPARQVCNSSGAKMIIKIDESPEAISAAPGSVLGLLQISTELGVDYWPPLG